MKAFKGFHKNPDGTLQCQDKTYRVGETYTEDTAELCQTGMHACLAPIDVLSYYPPAESVYHEVEVGDDAQPSEGGDSQVATTTLTVGAELGVPELVAAQVEYTVSRAKPETDPRLPHDPWILPTREQVARVLFASVHGDDVDWDEASRVRHEFYLDDADAVLALLSPWRQVEPGTTIKAGTRYRIEDESGGCYERTSVNDWQVNNRPNRVYIDPRTVPAEPDPRVKVVAQVLAEKAGISLDEAEATLVVQALDRMGDDSVTYPPTTAHHMEDL